MPPFSVAVDDTIAAIATPPGTGGIGVIRISGPEARAILARLFHPTRRPGADFESHKLHHGWICDPASGARLDEVLAVYMRAPATYTREDVVEIHCHSSFVILRQVLDLVFAAGARPAEPGEFTKRAFLNGRIDLTRAEAVLDMLAAKTARSLDLAVASLAGSLHTAVEQVRDVLVEVGAVLEVAIDFPEEEAEIADPLSLGRRIQEHVCVPLADLLAAGRRTAIYRDGVRAVIAGRPNVGKSSLLNALLREERAIVTAVPGTTRDSIEEYLDIHGVPVRLVDTAGLRQGAETVEAIGIDRARRHLAEADIVLLVLDGGEPLTDEDRALLDELSGRPCILVCNKMDLGRNATRDLLRARYPSLPVVPLSARTGDGVGDLEKTIYELATRGAPTDGAVSLNARQTAALARALEAAERLAANLTAGLSYDLVSVDLQECLDHLAAIVGQTTPDDILDQIFSEFCIGK